MMNVRTTLALFVTGWFWASSAVAEGWAMFSQQSAMKNYVIVDVGEAGEIQPPYGVEWDKKVFHLNGRCFVFSGYSDYWSYGQKPAFLLVNDRKDVRIALLETSIGSIKVEVKGITLIQCPESSNFIPYSDDPEENLRLLREYQQKLQKQLEDLQKQR